MAPLSFEIYFPVCENFPDQEPIGPDIALMQILPFDGGLLLFRNLGSIVSVYSLAGLNIWYCDQAHSVVPT